MEKKEIDLQKLGGKLVSNEIYYCASYIVTKMSEYEPDEWFDLFGSDDWEEPARYHIYNEMDHDACIEYIEENTDWDIEPYRKETLKSLRDDVSRHVEDDYQKFCDAHNLDPERNEVYEHWIVSDWLARKLEKRGEVVEQDFHGLTIWGRCCTGQAILLDHVIQQIALETYT